MKTFKKGDRFIPRKPKNTSQYPTWSMDMDKFNGRVLTFATLGDVKKPFLIVTTNHHEGIKYAEGTAKAPYEPYTPLIPLSPNHIPDVGKTIDWEQRKYELAKEFMAAQISGCIAGNISWNHKDCIRDAFMYADEMIKQLKQR